MPLESEGVETDSRPSDFVPTKVVGGVRYASFLTPATEEGHRKSVSYHSTPFFSSDDKCNIISRRVAWSPKIEELYAGHEEVDVPALGTVLSLEYSPSFAPNSLTSSRASPSPPPFQKQVNSSIVPDKKSTQRSGWQRASRHAAKLRALGGVMSNSSSLAAQARNENFARDAHTAPASVVPIPNIRLDGACIEPWKNTMLLSTHGLSQDELKFRIDAFDRRARRRNNAQQDVPYNWLQRPSALATLASSQLLADNHKKQGGPIDSDHLAEQLQLPSDSQLKQMNPVDALSALRQFEESIFKQLRASYQPILERIRGQPNSAKRIVVFQGKEVHDEAVAQRKKNLEETLEIIKPKRRLVVLQMLNSMDGMSQQIQTEMVRMVNRKKNVDAQESAARQALASKERQEMANGTGYIGDRLLSINDRPFTVP